MYVVDPAALVRKRGRPATIIALHLR